ncbi:MAG TPA: hypothetical protein VLM19_01305 [Nitrospiraceae bacterium]|nr:hypothetical protein [Nitrospiraceae bacterium]
MRQIAGAPRVSKFGAALFSAALLLGAGATAHAITFTDANGCGGSTCFGSVYNLTSTSLGGTQYRFDLSIDTSLFNKPEATGLDGVAIKVVANANDIAINSNGFSSNAASFSSLGELGLDSNGCGGGGGGFLCASSSNVGGVAVPNGTYTFQWLTTISDGKFKAENEWSLKALYVALDRNGLEQGRGLTSASGAVPVPGTVLMFGLGFALFIGWQYYRSHHKVGSVGVTA